MQVLFHIQYFAGRDVCVTDHAYVLQISTSGIIYILNFALFSLIITAETLTGFSFFLLLHSLQQSFFFICVSKFFYKNHLSWFPILAS